VFDIREFRNVFNWLEVLSHNKIPDYKDLAVDLIPSISFSGELRILSPELSEISSEKYSNFVVGNVTDKNFSCLISKATELDYYRDFAEGRRICYRTCDYFSFCLGGEASNKLTENRDLKSAETTMCINSKKHLIDVVLDALMEENNE
jgi:uncharacterized protein